MDATPTPFFRDSPAWSGDRAIAGYLATCRGKPGDPVSPAYLDGVLAAATVNEAVRAYEAGDYGRALELYQAAAATPAGGQLRVHNGLFLANWALGRREAAAEAFGGVVDQGLRTGRLAVKLLFQPGTVAYWPDPEVTAPYPVWLEQIARRTARGTSCLEVVGHTSPTGPAVLNDRLSALRAERVAGQLRADEPGLAGRLAARGAGSRETIVGTGTDDATDALDRRVEFRPVPCAGVGRTSGA